MAKQLLLSVPEAAKALKVSERTVNRRIEAGRYVTKEVQGIRGKRIPLSNLKKDLDSCLYAQVKATLERGEVLFPEIPGDSQKYRKKPKAAPKAAPKMKAPAKPKAKTKANGKK